MDESERLKRRNEYYFHNDGAGVDLEAEDENLANRIAALLNHPKINQYCMVDAYYYDFSIIPHGIQEKLQLWRDAYMIFGITTEGEMITKWVDRWDLDSVDPIVDGKVMHGENKPTNMLPPEVKQFFDPRLLSTPLPEYLIKIFDKS